MIDARPKEVANRMYENPRNELHLAAISAMWQVIRRGDVHLRDRNAVLGQSYVSYDGHFSISAAGVTGLKIDQSSIEQEDIARAMLLSFPQGTVLVSPEWMVKLLEAKNKLAFFERHAYEIESASVEFFENGGKLRTCGALFGFSSLALIADVITQEVDGRVIQTVLTAPADGGVLEGINLWTLEWDPARLNEAIFCNALMGSSPICLVTAFINANMERDLVRTMWQTVSYFQKAQEAGVHLEDWLAKEAPTILRRRRIYQGLEFFAQRALGMRRLIRSKVVMPPVSVKEFSDSFENEGHKFKQLIIDEDFVERLPASDGPPAILVNGEPTTADNFLFFRIWDSSLGSSLDDLSSSELANIENALKRHCKRKFTEDDLDKYRHLMDTFYYSETNKSQPRSYKQTFEDIQSNTFFNLLAKKYLWDIVLGDAFDCVIDEFSTHFAGCSRSDIRAIIMRVATYTIFLPLIRPSGLIAQWASRRIRQSLLPARETFAAVVPSIDAELEDLARLRLQHVQTIQNIHGKIESAVDFNMQLRHQRNLKAEEITLQRINMEEYGLITIKKEFESQESVGKEQEEAERDV